MNWFNNLNIKSKLIIGFLLIIILLASMTLFAINRLNKVADIYNNTIKYPMTIRGAIIEAQSAYNDLRRFTSLIVAFAPANDPERIDELYKDALTAYATAVNTIQKFEGLMKVNPLLNEEERIMRFERTNALKNYMLKYKNEACDPIMLAASAGDYKKCMEIVGNLTDPADEARMLIDELLVLSGMVAERTSNKALVTANYSKALLVSISLITFFISIVLAILIASFAVTALRARESALLTVSAIFDSNPHINILFDDAFNVIDCNPEAVKFMGFKNKKELLNGFVDLVSRTLPLVLSNGQRSQTLTERLKAAADEGWIQFETELSFNGGLHRLSVDLRKIHYKNSFAIVAYIFDMTEMFQREMQLARAIELNELQLAKLNLVVKGTKIGLWDMEVVRDDPVNPNNTFVWSTEFRHMLGYTDENDFPNVLSSWSNLLHPEDKEAALDLFAKHILDKTGKTPYDVEYRLKRKTGEYAFFRASGESIRDKNGNAIRVAGALMDITDTKNMLRDKERQREEAEAANRAKSTFLATMSHEIRTPMNAIIGMTTIGKSAADTIRKDYCFSKIEDASNHLLGVINDILDMSKIEANKFDLVPAEFELEKMLKRVVNVVNFRIDEKRQELSVHIDHSIPRSLVGDDQRIAQVITNLLGNAVKFTPERGAISLTVRLLERANDVCTLQISVNDTGIGITKEQQKKLFRSFEQAESSTTRKYGGSGLGLAISKNIVEMMGGKIWVQSEPGKGSTFTFTIQVKTGKEEKHEYLHNVNLKDIRILAVDDDPVILSFFDEVTKRFELPCDTAISGEKALELIEQNSGYNIYFIDWKMPGMDGIQLAREIKTRKSENSIVTMISAAEWSVIAKEAKAAGVDKFLSKPLFPSTLAEIIKECLGVNQKTEITQETDTKGVFAGRRILLAEDVEINREIVQTLLEPTELKIDCAENGAEAVRMFGEAPDQYDLIFMDIQMPEMDGYDATRRIRAMNDPKAKTVPIVAMTANVFKEDIEKCLASGMDSHIGKPLDFGEVMSALHSYLG